MWLAWSSALRRRISCLLFSSSCCFFFPQLRCMCHSRCHLFAAQTVKVYHKQKALIGYIQRANFVCRSDSGLKKTVSVINLNLLLYSHVEIRSNDHHSIFTMQLNFASRVHLLWVQFLAYCSFIFYPRANAPNRLQYLLDCNFLRK